MHYIRLTPFMVALCTLSSVVLAEQKFSPYTDFTINTHWSYEYQDMEPMDLNTITSNNHIKGLHLAFITDSGACQPAWGSQATYGLADKWASPTCSGNNLQKNDYDFVRAFIDGH